MEREIWSWRDSRTGQRVSQNSTRNAELNDFYMYLDQHPAPGDDPTL